MINQAEIIALLDELVSVAGVTGYEDAVRKKITQLLEPTGTDISTDHMGNLYAVSPAPKNSKRQALRVMIVAHMDEVGYLVKGIDSHGFVYLHPLGGLSTDPAPGEWVSLHGNDCTIQGCVGAPPPHLPVSAQRESFVDIGAKDKESVLQWGVSLGTPVTLSRRFVRLHGDRIMGRCFDNRMGCALLIAFLRSLSTGTNNDRAATQVWGVFSTTEEHGMGPEDKHYRVHGARGALTAAIEARPDFALVLDSIACSDIPGIYPHLRQITLGQGPALRLADELAIMRSPMRTFLTNLAKEKGINIQAGICGSYTDASAVQLLNIPTAALGIPVRYAHSPAQIADLNDLTQTLVFIDDIVQNAGKYQQTIPPPLNQ